MDMRLLIVRNLKIIRKLNQITKQKENMGMI